jgi:hypothetical protein
MCASTWPLPAESTAAWGDRLPGWGGVSIERILDRMSHIAIDEAHHGPAAEHRYGYGPTYILRGLSELHLSLTTADSVASVH